MRFIICVLIALTMIASVLAQHGDGSAYSVGPAWHFLQDTYRADGVEADADNDGAIDRANDLQTVANVAQVLSPVGGNVILEIRSQGGSESTIHYNNGGAVVWNAGKDGGGDFVIDRVGVGNALRVNNQRNFGFGAPAGITERITVNGGISITKDPDSDDDVIDKGWADTHYVNEGQANSITTNMIVDNSITSNDIANGAIVLNDMDLGDIDTRYVNENQANSISSAMIIDGSITVADLNDASIDGTYAKDSQIDGTIGRIPRWSTVNNLADSALFQSGASIGIGTTTPGYTLHVNGGAAATSFYALAGGGFFYASDRVLKENIKPLEGSLSKLSQLEGVSFSWKETGEGSLGLIAQDVEKIYPELVHADLNGQKYVEYGNLVAPLIEAVKEQQRQIESQKQEIDELRKEIAELKER